MSAKAQPPTDDDGRGPAIEADSAVQFTGTGSPNLVLTIEWANEQWLVQQHDSAVGR